MTPREKYKVIQKLDAGGMAEVFLAEAESIEGFKKRVAIKRVLPELVEQEKALAMFLDEARLSLRFNHANIVHTFDVGRSGNTYFIVMEYVEGTNLKRIVEVLKRRGDKIPLPLVLYTLIEVCNGLAYAHDFRDHEGNLLNVVHRDVSPPNVLISKQGEVKIVDFGLAKAASQLETTDTGMVKGKFAYLAPEVAYGNPADLRADIFACGIILFELLTGERLFLGKSDLKTIELVRSCNIPSITQRNKDVTPELEGIVLKALERSPENRYQSAHELSDALTSYLFAHSLKVSPYDLHLLIDSVLKESSAPKAPKLSVIDQLIQDELGAFASLDHKAPVSGRTSSSPHGAAPLDPTGFSGAAAATEKGTWRQGNGKGKASHIFVPQPAQSGTSSNQLAQMLEGDARRAAEPVSERPSAQPSSQKNFLMITGAAAFFGLGLGILVLYLLGIIPPS
jgi:eukaryotic-like serine/threonine-protein kinase